LYCAFPLGVFFLSPSSPYFSFFFWSPLERSLFSRFSKVHFPKFPFCPPGFFFHPFLIFFLCSFIFLDHLDLEFLASPLFLLCVFPSPPFSWVFSPPLPVSFQTSLFFSHGPFLFADPCLSRPFSFLEFFFFLPFRPPNPFFRQPVAFLLEGCFVCLKLKPSRDVFHGGFRIFFGPPSPSFPTRPLPLIFHGDLFP